MTEKIARRGVAISTEYAADLLSRLNVADFATRAVVCLQSDELVSTVVSRLNEGRGIASHHGYPVTRPDGSLAGVVTRMDLVSAPPASTIDDLIRGPLISVGTTATLRDAVTLMTRHRIGRLPVLDGGKLVGILTRGDVLNAHGVALAETTRAEPGVMMPWNRTGAAR